MKLIHNESNEIEGKLLDYGNVVDLDHHFIDISYDVLLTIIML